MRGTIQVFEGLVPRLDDRRLGANQAQIAENCDLSRGVLDPIKEPSDVTSVAAGTLTVFPYGTGWLAWSTIVDVVQSIIENDVYERIHYTGDGNPKVRGLESGVEQVRYLGVPVPTGAPTVTVQDKGAVVWSRNWKYQYEKTDGSGTVTQGGSLVEATDFDEDTPGLVYSLNATGWLAVARTTAAASDQLVLLFDGLDANSKPLGRLYPSISAYQANTEFVLSGAPGTAAQVTDESATTATFTITYNTSASDDFKLERTYRMVNVNFWNEESAPGPVSTEVAVSPTEDVNLTALNTTFTADANYNVTKQRIYRTVATEAGTTYQFVAEIDLGDTTYLDAIADDDLTAPTGRTDGTMLSTGWSLPPSSLKGLVAMPGGFLAGFNERTVYFSEVGYPHAWPDYGRTVPYDIQAIGVTRGTLVVVTKGGVWCYTGNTPDALNRVEGSLQQPCSNAAGMAQVGNVLVYPSPDGLVGYEGPQGVILTESFYTEKQWTGVSPTTMIAAVHDGRYYAWSSAGALFFDLTVNRGGLVTTDETPTALYADLETDSLYVVDGTDLKLWEGGSVNKTIGWQGREIENSFPDLPRLIRLKVDSYTDKPSVEIYQDGTLVATMIFSSKLAQKTPGVLNRAEQWEFKINAKSTVHELTWADSMDELRVGQ